MPPPLLLRSLLRLRWPAVQSEPMLEHERYLQQGSDFHRLAQQALVGLPVERLSASLVGEDFSHWWGNFLDFLPGFTRAEPRWQIYPEISLTAPLGDTRLVGKYDLVAAHPGERMLIYDWKTSRQRSKLLLEKRLQTRLYPYLLVAPGAFLNAGVSIQPEQVEMVYWFAEHPVQPERFAYSSAAYQADEVYLTSLIETVMRLDEADFTLTDDERLCAYCVYRSLCNRVSSQETLLLSMPKTTTPYLPSISISSRSPRSITSGVPMYLRWSGTFTNVAVSFR